MHVRTRSSLYAATGGVCDRPRRRPSSDAQSAPSAAALASPAEISSSASRFVFDRGNSRRRTTIVQRTDVRSRSVDGTSGVASNAGPAFSGSEPIPHYAVAVTTLNRRLVAAVRWYQQQAEGRPSPCRFTPSCSCYAVEALESHGAKHGLWLTLRRLLRCRPFGPSGFDPVPEVFPQKVM